MVLNLDSLFRKKIPRTVTTFIWDVDGTLYQTTDEIFDEMCKVTIDFIAGKKRKSKRQIERYIYEQVKRNRLLGEVVEKDYGLDKHTLAKLAEEKIDKSRYVESNELLVNLLEKDLVRFKHAILTNGSYRNTVRIINKLGLSKSHFMSIHTMDDLGKDFKPAEKAFRRVLTTHNLGPEESLIIGDSLTQDIFPAKKIGMATCFIDPQGKVVAIDEADFIVRDPVEIAKFVK